MNRSPGHSRIRYLFPAAAMLLIAGTALAAWLGRALPERSGTIRADGLDAPVTVLRDRYGVPSIIADNRHDLYFAQGFVHAQDRFWQMELHRRLGAGRLAEWFGEDLLPSDISSRTLGFERTAREEYRRMDGETRAVLDAYVDGVNAWIRDRSPGSLGLEFAMLPLAGAPIRIEPWEPHHSLVWAKVMADGLGYNRPVERLRLDLIRSAGLGAAASFFSAYRPEMPVILSDDELAPGLLRQERESDPGTDGNGDGDPDGSPDWPVIAGSSSGGGTGGFGSNGWVIAGSRTSSGLPILANDVHLDVSMPSLWYMQTMIVEDGTELPLRGMTFPGVPGIVIGDNGRIAWGITDMGDDVQDLCVERVDPRNPDRYSVGGGADPGVPEGEGSEVWIPMEIRMEEIRVRDREEPFPLRVRSTRNGPVISDYGSWTAMRTFLSDPERGLPGGLFLGELSLRRIGGEPGELLRSILLMNRARNFREFRQALALWNAPAMNFVYADTEGNTGFQAAGRIPIRTRGNGTLPIPGWDNGYRWKGFVPFEELPWNLNPSKGYLVAANNPVASGRYAHLLGTDTSFGFRARRIVELIESVSGGIGPADVRRMQGDVLDRSALRIIRAIGEVDVPAAVREDAERKARWDREDAGDGSGALEDTGTIRERIAGIEEGRKLLTSWDGNLRVRSAAAALFGFVWIELVEALFRDQYPPDRWPPRDQERLRNSVLALLEEPGNPWWDDRNTTEVREGPGRILGRALVAGYDETVERLGEDVRRWRWGRLHRIEFRSPTLGESGIAVVERLFNPGPYPMPGGFDQVNVAGWSLDEPFRVRHIPTARFVFDAADPGTAWFMLAPGQSGHPLSPHYDDLVDLWRTGGLIPLSFDRGKVERRARSRLVLEPDLTP